MEPIAKLNSYINSAIPYAWDDSESWFEFLAKVLNKVNELVEASNEYFAVDLETYVENLLITWANNGTLTNIIANLVSTKAEKSFVISEDNQIRIDTARNVDLLDEQLKNIINNKFATLDAKINTQSFGGPKGVFATLVDLQNSASANTVEGRKYIYVVTADNNWYYWNGSAWSAGGAYSGAVVNVQGIVKGTGTGGYSAANTNDILQNMYVNADVTNIFDDGQFNNGVAGWDMIGATLTAENNVGIFKSTSQYGRVIKPFNTVVGRNYLAVFTLKSNSPLVCVSMGTNKKYHTGNGQPILMYLIFTATDTLHGFAIDDERSGGWDNVEISNIMLFNYDLITAQNRYIYPSNIVEAIRAIPGMFVSHTTNIRIMLTSGKFANNWFKPTDPTAFAGVEKYSNLFEQYHAGILDNSFVMSTDGSLNQNNNYALSHYIEVKPGETYTISTATTETAAFFEDNYQFVEGHQNLTIPPDVVRPYSFVVPNNPLIKYMRVNIKKSMVPMANFVISRGSGLLEGTVYKANWGKEDAPMVGKKLLVSGDSITEKNFRAATVWGEYVSSWLGCSLVNDGFSSTGFVKQDGDNGGIITRADGWLSKYGDFDAILVMGNMNDGNYPTPIPVGTMQDSVDVHSQYGIVKNLIEKLIRLYPLKPIGFITSPPRKTNPTYPAPYNGKAWGVDGWFEGWANAIVDVCRNYSIPCLDLYHESGLKPWNDANSKEYFSSEQAPNGDGIHPNEKGQKVIARKIFEFVKKYLLE